MNKIFESEKKIQGKFKNKIEKDLEEELNSNIEKLIPPFIYFQKIYIIPEL